MQLKRYEAPTIKEALSMVKTDLGKDAVIFSSKILTSKNNPARKYVEVMAAVERNDFTDIINRDNGLSNVDFMSASEPLFSSHLKYLLLSGFSHDMAWYLIGEASAKYNSMGRKGQFKDVLLDILSSHIPVGGPVSLKKGCKKIVAFVGPTGVGKTTTLAKIAARFSINTSVRVKIITIDTYRIAAAQQIEIYGKIMGLPVCVAGSTDELRNEIRVNDGSDLILIDTAGRNFLDSKMVEDLKKWINRYEEIESHLLLSATTSQDVISRVISSFNSCRVDRIIITKIDESPSMGHLYSPLMRAGKPVSYITMGQKVPEDIRSASSDLLAGLFFDGFNKDFVL